MKVIKVSSEQPADMPISSAMAFVKCWWMGMPHDSEGNIYMVGESFRSDSYGTYFARGLATSIFTLGLVGVTWANLYFTDIVILPIQSQEPPQLLKLKERKVQVGIHLQPYEFAKHAAQSGEVRYFGNDRKGGIYVLDGTFIKRVDLATQQIQVLGQIPKTDYRVTFFSSANYLLFFKQHNAYNQVHFSLFSLVKP